MIERVRILVVDDEEGMRDLLVYELEARGFQVLAAADGEEALAQVRNGGFSVALTDVRMPGLGGLELLDAIKRLRPEIEVILLTGYASIDVAVSAMKRGAYDFVQKPFNIVELVALIEKALEKRELKAMIALHAASQAAFRSLKLETVLPLVVRLVSDVIGADDASILLLEGGGLRLAASHGLNTESARRENLAVGERVAGRVAQTLEPVSIVGPLEGDTRFPEVSSQRAIKSSLVHPLAIEGEVLGVLTANRTSRPDPFNAADLRHMTIFCTQIAHAVYNAKSYRKLQETQQQLVQSEKLNAVGLLAAGVAHELNNPLTSILGFAELLREHERLPAALRADLDCIIDQASRCRVITQQLLHLSRNQEPRKEPLGILDVLESALSLARFENSETKLVVDRSWPASSPVVFADRLQLQQVFLNLMANARRATETSPRRRLEIGVETRGGRCVVRFADNGCGIRPEDMPRLFTPFFTTQPVGKGTGLGLSICRTILDKHGGTISAASPPGEGAVLTVDLPLHGETARGGG